MVLSKSEDEEPIIECKMNGKIWNSRMDGWTARRAKRNKNRKWNYVSPKIRNNGTVGY